MAFGRKDTSEEAARRRILHRKEQAGPELFDALKGLYEDNADYILRNNLGAINHNYSMRRAWEALCRAGYEPMGRGVSGYQEPE